MRRIPRRALQFLVVLLALAPALALAGACYELTTPSGTARLDLDLGFGVFGDVAVLPLAFRGLCGAADRVQYATGAGAFQGNGDFRASFQLDTTSDDCPRGSGELTLSAASGYGTGSGAIRSEDGGLALFTPRIVGFQLPVCFQP